MNSEPVRAFGAFTKQLIEFSRKRRAEAERLAPEIRAAEAKLRVAAELRRKENILPHLEACGVGGKTLDAFRGPGLKRTAALECVRKWIGWLEIEKPFLVLYGGFGTGKSVAAAYALLSAIRPVRAMAHGLADEPVCWDELDSSRGLFATAATLRYASRYEEGKELSLVDKATRVRWLVLDELRMGDADGKGQSRFEEILGHRYERGLRTVITTNLDQTGVKKALGDRLASRLHEGAEMVDCGDVDLRRAQSEKQQQAGVA